MASGGVKPIVGEGPGRLRPADVVREPRRGQRQSGTAVHWLRGRIQHRRLDAAQAVFEAHGTAADPAGAARAIGAARAEADRLVGWGARLAEATFASDALASLLAEGHIPPKAIVGIMTDLRVRADTEPLAVGLRVLHHPQLILLPLEEFLDVALTMLEALGPLRSASIWTHDDLASRVPRWGSEMPAAAVGPLAGAVLAGELVATEGSWTALRIPSFAAPRAALVFNVARGQEQDAVALATSLVQLLGRAFERADLLATSAARAAALEQRSERRITRVGIDLHDGPLQDIALLAAELDDLRAQIATGNREAPAFASLLERVDDIAALVSYLDFDLRSVANSLYATGTEGRPFAQSLDGIVRGFAIRSNVEPHVDLQGDLETLSDSLRAALLRIIQECLANVQEHSMAREVRIQVVSGASEVRARIEDDGIGFDVEDELRASAGCGSLGLLGIVERVRLLGGTCDIRSRPGEGCEVAVTVARWTLEMAAMATAETASRRG